MSARRLLPAVVATLTVTLAGWGLSASPSAASAGRCPRGTGVTVVVDYGPLGGGVVTACDPDGAGRSATEVMGRTGFDLTYVNNQPGFVCRIDGKPDASQESCANTPPADAYWGLFSSDGDPATWAYSNEGAGSLDVPEGGSIGWRFEDGGTREDPGAPPTAAASTPSPSPSPSPHQTRNPSSPSPAPSDTAEPPKPTPTPTPSASVPPGTKGSNPSPSEGAGAGSGGERPHPADHQEKQNKQDKGKHDTKGHHHGGGEPVDVSATPSPSPSPAVALSPASGKPLTHDDGSSSALTLVAGGAVLVLAGAAGVIAWRRRA